MQRTHHKFQSATNLRNGKLPSTAPLATRQIAVPIENEVSALLREKLDLHAQLFEASQIQRKLSGPRELRCGDIEFASEVFAARYLSGDFTMLLQNGSRVTATLGDIAGKGIAAGMWFTNLAGLLQSYGGPDSDPSMTAAEINRRLYHLRPGAPFVTAFLAQVDCCLGVLKYCNAGHFPPILLRADGRTELLETGGPLLGAIEDAGYKSAQVMLEPGDTVIAYSDGLLECRDASGEEFGQERVMTVARQSLKYSAHAVLLLLLAAVQDFANGTLLCDDVSVTVIQRCPEGFAA